jgi:DTW domain-containing protein YfiP
MPDQVSSKRAMCAACLRPCATCICKFAAPVASAVDVLILQHPLEVSNAKGTARLLHLCVPGSTMATGEAFEEPVLQELLYAGSRRPRTIARVRPIRRSCHLAPRGA